MHANQKTREGKDHPDRDAQFRHINETTRAALAAGEPTISVDAKKRELVGDFKAVGREYEPTERPVEVRCHDFKDKDLGHAIPYGVLDLAANEGFVSVGVTNDTSAFAVSSIRAWWMHLGQKRYPNATTLLITADGGGSNSSRTRLWRTELVKLRQRATDRDPRLPLPARNLEMEQNRAPPVQLRQPELARAAAGEPASHHRPDRIDHDQHRPEGLRAP